MKYFSISSVVEAYNKVSASTKEKFWGILGILHSIDETVCPNKSYSVETGKLSQFFEDLFRLNEKREYSGTDEYSFVFSTHWVDVVSEDYLVGRPDVTPILVWAYRNQSFPNEISVSELFNRFLEDYHVSKEVAEQLFKISFTEQLKFEDSRYSDSDLLLKLGGSEASGSTTLKLNGAFAVANAGDLSRGPYFQPLYAALQTLKCLTIYPFNIHDYYDLEDYGNQEEEESGVSEDEMDFHSRQIIYYGAPGTGKSHEVNRLTKGERVVRTTFHPDSDYATFVGAYKPTMEESDIHVVPVVVNNGISLQNKGSFKEKRIVYRFVMQAFLKAYLSAWKKYADANSTNVQSLTLNASNAIYTITGVDDNRVSYNKRFQFPVTPSKMGAAWKAVWEKGTFVIPTGPMPGKSIELALSKWIHDNIENCTKESLEQGLESFKQMVRETGTVVISIGSSGSQDYAFTASEDGDTFFVSTNAGSTIPLLKDYYSGVKDMDEATDIVRKICEMLYELDSNSFENALNRMKDVVNTNEETDDAENKDIEPEPQFLVIEEINRGNCAQIFGDLFQLLDRGCNGFSEYPIDADTDLQKEIEKAFKEHKDYKLENDIQVDGVVDGYESNYGATLSEDIQHGRVLLLPSNLYIWATMNTSDQSLFPIDSAFKRRWDWKYIPIEDAGKNWKIKVNGNEYDWYQFLEDINKEVFDLTHSEDKQLGYFFAKAKDNIIDAETLVNKVYFYLWTDVFKDYEYESLKAFRKADGKGAISFKDFFANGKVNEDMAEQVILNLKNKKQAENAE